MSKRRVVITGMGVVSPIGLNLSDNWQALMSGTSGIGQITQFDPTGFPSTIAGEVRGFDVTQYISEKEARRMDRFIHLGMAAGIQAVKDSGLEVTEANAEQIGVHIGSGIGGLNTMEGATKTILEKGHRD